VQQIIRTAARDTSGADHLLFLAARRLRPGNDLVLLNNDIVNLCSFGERAHLAEWDSRGAVAMPRPNWMATSTPRTSA
jgi:hypothetical protein